MTRDDQRVWDATLGELRTQRAIDPHVLELLSTELAQLALVTRPFDSRGVVLVLTARLLYVLAHEDDRG